MGVYKSRLSNKMLIVLIVICLSVIFFSIYKKNDNVIATFNEYDINNKTYIINLEGRSITTRNLDKYDDYDIVAIYPDISVKYNKIINSGWYNIDSTISFNSNIKRLENYYQKLYSYNDILNEYLDIEYNGLVIKKIKIITDSLDKYNDYDIEK